MILSIDFAASLVNIAETLIVTAITSLAAILFTRKYLKEITFANKMKKYGFSTSVTTNDISSREYKMIFEKAAVIRIIYVSGNSFFKKPERIRQVKKALERGAQIKILLARKDNVFLKDIFNLEVEAGYREYDTTIDQEVDAIHAILTEIQKEIPHSGLEVRYYSSEYRMPMTIAEFSDKDSEYALSWLNITLPPYKSQKKFLLRGREDFSSDHAEEGNLVLMMMKHFDSVWERSLLWEETASEYWKEKYREAQKSHSLAEKNPKVLIQASAQHPLEAGLYPNEEFKSRLQVAMQYYTRWKQEGKDVKIYVPGSRHKTEKGEDRISLSEAGCTFLKENGIPEEDILGEEKNIEYKGSEGVYNSADECYVSSSIYKREGYGTLCCICSPLQSVKNILFYLEQGILAQIYTVPCAEQFHDPYFEAAVMLPDILHYDHSWQKASSFYGMKTRKERIPDSSSSQKKSN